MNLLPNEQQYVNANFKCIVKSWGVREPKLGASTVMISLELQIRDAWDPATETWTSWETIDPPFGLYANVCVIKKDGQPNQTGIDQLSQSLSWDGTMAFFLTPPRPYLVIAQTAWNEYQGKKTIQVNWISHGGSAPRSGGLSNTVDGQAASNLDAQFGSILRASVTKPAVAPAVDDVPF